MVCTSAAPTTRSTMTCQQLQPSIGCRGSSSGGARGSNSGGRNSISSRPRRARTRLEMDSLRLWSKNWTMVLLLLLLVTSMGRNVRADDDGDGLGLATVLPTIIAEEPSSLPSIVPTMLPSQVPTLSLYPSIEPTISQIPSSRPTLSFLPTFTVSPSSRPSPAPTEFPTTSPSFVPSQFPSVSSQPSKSLQPTVSFRPTLSSEPTKTPSSPPSAVPSVQPTSSSVPSGTPSGTPSDAPSASVQPSSIPTLSWEPTVTPEPTSTPSVPPSASPTLTPSATPTFPRPTPVVSESPSEAPSLVLSSRPSLSPSVPPSLTQLVTKKTIRMVISNLPELASEQDQSEWERVTTNHVLDYYRDIEAAFPDTAPIQIASVETEFQRQTVVPSNENENQNENENDNNTNENENNNDQDTGLLLEIEYSQTIIYGVSDKDLDENEVNFHVFEAPFEYDSIAYIIALYQSLGAQEWLELVSVTVVGEEPSSRGNNKDRGLSKRALRSLSVILLLLAGGVVAYLLWERHKNEQRYLQSQIFRSQVADTLEFDNAGQPIDWRNPYNEGTTTGGGATSGGSGSAQQSLPPPQDAPSTPTPSPIAVIQSRSPRSPRSPKPLYVDRMITTTVPTTTGSGAGSRHSSRVGNILGLPPLPYRSSHARHSAISDTEITDITYSDGGGSGSGSGGDFFPPPRLPTTDERFPSDLAPLSPLHIPDVDLESDINAAMSPPSSPTRAGTGMLGLESDNNTPSMSGFAMRVEELE